MHTFADAAGAKLVDQLGAGALALPQRLERLPFTRYQRTIALVLLAARFGHDSREHLASTEEAFASVAATVGVGTAPEGVGVDPTTHRVY